MTKPATFSGTDFELISRTMLQLREEKNEIWTVSRNCNFAADFVAGQLPDVSRCGRPNSLVAVVRGCLFRDSFVYGFEGNCVNKVHQDNSRARRSRRAPPA
jgi:hypothetical protein